MHTGALHTPATQASVPPLMLQWAPQAPQLAGSVAVWVSQPFAGFVSQSAKPELHATTLQVDAAHFSTALLVLHAALHPPQFATSFVVFTHDAPLPMPQRVGVAVGQV